MPEKIPKIINAESEEILEPEIMEEVPLKPEITETKKDDFDRDWDAHIAKLRLKYMGFEVKRETKTQIENELEKEEDKAKIEYVERWLSDNNDSLEKEYPQLKGMDKNGKIRFALVELKPEKNPLTELNDNEETQEKYKDFAEKFANMYILREGMKKEPPDAEVGFLALNFFYEKAEAASKDFHNKERNPKHFSKEEIEASKKEWFRHSKIVRELTEKVTGKDPKGQAEKEAEDPEKKKEFVASQMNRFEEIKLKRYDQILDGLSEEEKKYFKAGIIETRAGKLNQEQILAIVGTYGADALRSIKHKNWFSNKILIRGKEVESEDLDSFLAGKKQELDEKIRKELEEAAEYKWKKESRKDVGKRFDEIIRQVASPEGAKDIVNEKFKRMKAEMIEKWEKEAQKRSSETKEKADQPEKTDAKTKKKMDSALDILKLNAKEPEEIEEYLKDNGSDFCDTMEKVGIKIDKKNVERFVKGKRNRKSLSIFIKRFLEFMAGSAS